MSAHGLQEPLFTIPVDERALGDAERTILEAIDKLGAVTPRVAGRIVYRLRGFTLTIAVPGAWLNAAGLRLLERLQTRELVAHNGRDRWSRR